jgi:hypothetical protein
MSSKEVTLALASFLDSAQAAGLQDIERADLRRVSEKFIGACFEQLGLKPNLMEGHELENLLVKLLPGHFKPKDALAESLPAVFQAYLAFLEETEVVPHLFEIRMALDPALDAFLDKVRSGQNTEQFSARQETVVHKAAKMGRNEACFCGSGKKFKKCHGKA